MSPKCWIPGTPTGAALGRRVLMIITALGVFCGAAGCQWIGGSPGQSSFAKLLDDEKENDDAIKAAALKDTSFPSATQRVSSKPQKRRIP